MAPSSQPPPQNPSSQTHQPYPATSQSPVAPQAPLAPQSTPQPAHATASPQAALAQTPNQAANQSIPIATPTSVTNANVDPATRALRQRILDSLSQQLPPLTKYEEYASAIRTVYIGLIIAPIVFIVGGIALLVFSYMTGLILCIGPLAFLMFVGALIIFLKTLFIRFEGARRERTLSRQAEPFLFAFVDRIAFVVNAPAPTKIHISTEVNASAAEEKGPHGQTELVLTLGLPLVVGLSLNQLSGVIAHELGHFTQNEATRSTSIAMNIARWLTKAVYQNELDQKRRLARGGSVEVQFVMSIIAFINHWILMGAIILLQFLVGHLSRKAEFDADRYITNLVGSDVMSSTFLRLGEIGASYERSVGTLLRFLNDRQLGDNFPRLVVEHISLLTPEERQEIQYETESRTTGHFDSHPSYNERIARSRAEQNSGIFNIDTDNSVLFTDLKKLCKDITWEMYVRLFGTRVKREDLKSMDDLIAEEHRQIEDATEVKRRFAGIFHVNRPFTFETSFIDDECDIPQRTQDLTVAIQQLNDNRDYHEKLIARYDVQRQKLMETEQAAALLTLAMSVPDQRLHALSTSRANAMAERDRAIMEMEKLENELASAELIMRSRVTSALDLLMTGACQFNDLVELKDEADDLVNTVFAIRDILPEVLKLHVVTHCLGSILRELEKYQVNHHVVTQVSQNCEAICYHLNAIKEGIVVTRNPLIRTEKTFVVDHLLLNRMNLHLGALNNPYEFFQDVDGFLDRFYAFYYRVVGRIGAIVELVESELGLSQSTTQNVS